VGGKIGRRGQGKNGKGNGTIEDYMIFSVIEDGSFYVAE
jgi:hypothetical protein